MVGTINTWLLCWQKNKEYYYIQVYAPCTTHPHQHHNVCAFGKAGNRGGLDVWLAAAARSILPLGENLPSGSGTCTTRCKAMARAKCVRIPPNTNRTHGKGHTRVYKKIKRASVSNP